MLPLMTAVLTSTAFLGIPVQPVPVILDTDIGDDIDDTWALAMLLGSPQVDLKLVVTAFGNTPAKTRLVAKILERLGRTDVPIGTGVKTSDQPIHQGKWLGDFDLRSYKGKVYPDGVQALIDTIHASPGPVTLLLIGPEVDIAEALKRDPSIAKKARVVAMAGSVRVGYDGSDKPAAEYNVVSAPEATQAVFAAPWDITLAPLDVCGTLRLRGTDYQRVAKSQARRAKLVIENYNLWSNRAEYPQDSSSILFDTVAAYLTMSHGLCTIEDLKLSVTGEGLTVIDPHGRIVHVATGWKDESGFKEALIRALTGGG